MTKIVSAYEARTNFGELLNEVYYKGEAVIISKSGKNIARIIKEEDSVSLHKKADDLWKKMRELAREGKQIDGVAFLRRDRDHGHKIHY